MIDVLIAVHEFAFALPLLTGLVRELRRSPESLRDVSVSLDRLADVLLKAGQADVEIDGARKTPLDLYRESLGLSQQIVSEFGRSPESLHDLIVSFSRLAMMAFGQEDAEAGGAHLKRCFAILEEIEARGWQDAQTGQFRRALEAFADGLG